MLNSFLAEYQAFLPKLNSGQISALEAHLELLERWNRTINLTAIKSRDEAVSKHLGESLFLAAHLPSEALNVCDLGSGGGFPGIPTAIARPDCQISLVEIDVRKGVFLREASRNVPNIRVLTQRFEALEGEFDWLISRAVNLSKVSGGPVCHQAAFLGTVEPSSKKRTHAGQFRWRDVPIPWNPTSFLSLGERFT
ncbi:MAG TPA: 16S rRNA (guanine(527)-N(7))-methyltransferase RsmG [Bryobacteraceae bacterium]